MPILVVINGVYGAPIEWLNINNWGYGAPISRVMTGQGPTFAVHPLNNLFKALVQQLCFSGQPRPMVRLHLEVFLLEKIWMRHDVHRFPGKNRGFVLCFESKLGLPGLFLLGEVRFFQAT